MDIFKNFTAWDEFDGTLDEMVHIGGLPFHEDELILLYGVSLAVVGNYVVRKIQTYWTKELEKPNIPSSFIR